MPEFDRKRALNNLNAQRRALKKKGADPTDMKDYFGISNTVPFGSLKDAELKRLYDNYKSAPTVQVIRGTILPTKYVRAHNVWYGADKRGNVGAPYVKSYKKALNTNFMTQDKTLADTRKRASKFNTYTQDRYVEALEMYGLADVAKGVNKMSQEEFWKFVRAGKGINAYEIFVRTDGEGNLVYDEQSEELIYNNLESIVELYEEYKPPSRRRKRPSK